MQNRRGFQAVRRRATAIDPHGLILRGFALQQQGDLTGAETLYRQAHKLDRRNFDALHLLGVVANLSGDFGRGVELISQAVKIKPDIAIAHFNLGCGLQETGRLEQALAAYDRALRLDPADFRSLNNRGNVLRSLNRLDEALTSFDRAIGVNPNLADPHLNRGRSLQQLKRLTEALASYDTAVALKPNHAEAHKHRAEVLRLMHRFAEAVESYERAISLDAGLEFAHGGLCMTRCQMCEWSDYDAMTARIIDGTTQFERVSEPFVTLFISNSVSLQRRSAEIWIKSKPRPPESPRRTARAGDREKIRIGYFSADFHNHATAALISGLFEHHDHSGFELIAYSIGRRSESAERRRIERAFDRFVDAETMSDEDLVSHARTAALDVAVDLKGFTQDARSGIFLRRVAPIQVNYLGYPGSMGSDLMDYLIADPILIPADRRDEYAEKIVYLPGSYLPNDRERVISERRFTRTEVGLPDRGFVFCCFNNNYKITPDVFSAWMRILGQVDGRVLWLLQDDAVAADNLRRAAAARNVDPARLIFAQRLQPAEHLARHRLADLALDTAPYNSHTTASDALWAGLPLLTKIGETFAARVAASLLTAIGLPELITKTRVDYEALAVELARTPERLAAIKAKLARNRLTTPLFDTAGYTRALEQAYASMHQRELAGIAPDHIVVDAISTG